MERYWSRYIFSNFVGATYTCTYMVHVCFILTWNILVVCAGWAKAPWGLAGAVAWLVAAPWPTLTPAWPDWPALCNTARSLCSLVLIWEITLIGADMGKLRNSPSYKVDQRWCKCQIKGQLYCFRHLVMRGHQYMFSLSYCILLIVWRKCFVELDRN